MAINRMQQLEAISQAIPRINQKVQGQRQAAQRLQFKKQALAAPETAATGTVAQAIAPQMAAATGDIALQTGAANLQAQGQVGQLALQEQQGAQQAKQQERALAQQANIGEDTRAQKSRLQQAGFVVQRAITDAESQAQVSLQEFNIAQDNNILQLSLEQQENLEGISRGLTGKLFDKRRQFTTEQGQLKLSNMEQAFTYALANVKSNQQLQRTMSYAKHESDKKQMFLRGLHQDIKRMMSEPAAMAELEAAGINAQEIAKIQLDMEQTINKYEQDAANLRAIIKGVSSMGSSYVTA